MESFFSNFHFDFFLFARGDCIKVQKQLQRHQKTNEGRVDDDPKKGGGKRGKSYLPHWAKVRVDGGNEGKTITTTFLGWWSFCFPHSLSDNLDSRLASYDPGNARLG